MYSEFSKTHPLSGEWFNFCRGSNMNRRMAEKFCDENGARFFIRSSHNLVKKYQLDYPFPKCGRMIKNCTTFPTTNMEFGSML